nr:RecName: Full=Galactose-binding lectin-2; Short=AKL-2 [Aplysia kurodai]
VLYQAVNVFSMDVIDVNSAAPKTCD